MVRRYDESTRKALEEIVSALGGSDSHSAFDLDEHREHRDAVERDDDHSAQAQHRHIGGYEDEGDEDFAPPTTWVAVKLLEATRRYAPRRSFPRRRGAASAPPSTHTWSAAAKSTPASTR